MRGIYTPVTDIRRKVFTEVARMSYESNEMADYAKEIRDLPFKIMPCLVRAKCAGLTSEPAYTTTSACSSSFAPRTVIKSSAPGPAPTN